MHAQVPSYVPTDGLVGWYPFNGNANDESGVSEDGEMFSLEAAEDRFGNANSAFYFSSGGCIPHIETNIDFQGSSEGMTISYWLNRQGSGCIYPRLFGFWSGGNNPQSWGMAWGNSAVLDYMGESPANNQWHHVLVTLNADSIHAYLNGELKGAYGSSKQPPLASYMSIGRMTHPAYDAFNGYMDDFGIWNRVLLPEEIESMYESDENPSISGCMDETACNFDPEATEDDGSCINADIVVDDSQLCESGVVAMSVFQNVAEGEPRSLSFSQGQYVRIPNSPSLSTFENGITLECWYKQTSFSGGDEHIVGHEYFSNEGVELNNQHGTWSAYVIGTDGSAGWNYWDNEDYNPPIVQNQWHHIALSSDGQTTKYFLNGEEMDEDVNDLGDLFSPSFSEDFVINRHTWASGSSSRLSGFMDELRLSSVCRYTESFTPPEAEFVVDEFTSGLWHFNEGGGGTVYDASPNGNHGTCLGTGWSEDTPITQSLTGGFDVFWNGGVESAPTYGASPGETVEVVIVGELGSCSEIINIESYDLEEGCADEDACNYSETAACNLGCVYPVLGAGDCNEGSVTCGPGTVWDAEFQTCVVAIPAYLNEPGEAAILNPCYFDSNGNGLVEVTDLMNVLSVYGLACGEIPEAAEFSCGDALNYQGYDYATVLIGDQCWFAENVRYLPQVSPAETGSEDNGLPHAYVYGNESSDVAEAKASENYSLFGALYNYIALSSWQLCPTGWHVANDMDFVTLEQFAGMSNEQVQLEGGTWRGTDEGYKLKSLDNNDIWWYSGGGSGIDGGGSDEFGFKALPGGARTTTPPGPYRSIHTNFNIWTPPYARSLAANEVTIWRRALGDNVVEEDACSVRCIQD